MNNWKEIKVIHHHLFHFLFYFPPNDLYFLHFSACLLGFYCIYFFKKLFVSIFLMYLSKFGYLFTHIWRYFSLEFFLVYVQFFSMVAKFISIFYKQYYFASILLYVFFLSVLSFCSFFHYVSYLMLSYFFILNFGETLKTHLLIYLTFYSLFVQLSQVCVFASAYVFGCVYTMRHTNRWQKQHFHIGSHLAFCRSYKCKKPKQ